MDLTIIVAFLILFAEWPINILTPNFEQLIVFLFLLSEVRVPASEVFTSPSEKIVALVALESTHLKN
mgnify:CR=1 FL=1